MTKLDTMLQLTEKAFEAEQERMKNLTDKSEKYVAVIVAIIGFQLLDLHSLNLTGIEAYYNLLAVLGLVSLGVAFAITLISNRIQTYDSYASADQYETLLENKQYDDDGVKMSFAKMYIAALKKNQSINDNRSKLLSLGSNLITIGFILIVVRYILEAVIT